ncbi:MAG: S-layer homology domain-containing protein, partial [Candidatus Peribacteraceae bacterium]|nr:S-layer homology domain-containing protein [Candidatus Peribacteraceae bacterium]
GDVSVDRWYAPYVYGLAQSGILSGYRDSRGKPTGEYGPENSVTYGEIAKMVVEAAGISIKSSVPQNRSARNEWSAEYVSSLEAIGVSVFDRASLDVNDPAPRGAIVQILLEAFNVSIQEANGNTYSDVPASHSYASAIETATADSIVSGDDGASTFRPNSSVNRAEVAKIVSRTIEEYK